MTREEAKVHLKERFQAKNQWVILLELSEECRVLQREYFKNRNKVTLVKAQLAEKELDLHIRSLKKLAIEKGLIDG